MINQRSFEALLKGHLSSLWSNRTIADSNISCRFIPIFQTEHKEAQVSHRYGIIQSGYWVSDISERKMVSPPEKYISFVPILEFKRTDIIEKIKKGISEVDLPDVVLTTFPFDAILESTWSHWKVLAEQWINDGYPLNDNLCQMFEENKNVIGFRKAREALLYGHN